MRKWLSCFDALALIEIELGLEADRV